MTEEAQHRIFLQQAIELARENVATGRGGPFGALVVKDGAVLARSGNQVLAEQDPTLHAEVSAIRAACRKLHRFELTDCIIYSSCEPCPMCLGAIYWARPKALYFAADRTTAARHGFDDDFIYREIALPAAQRHIPTRQIQLDGAEAPFVAWDQKTDKVPY